MSRNSISANVSDLRGAGQLAVAAVIGTTQQRTQAKSRYRTAHLDIAREIGLTPEEEDRLFELMAEHEIKGNDLSRPVGDFAAVMAANKAFEQQREVEFVPSTGCIRCCSEPMQVSRKFVDSMAVSRLSVLHEEARIVVVCSRRQRRAPQT